VVNLLFLDVERTIKAEIHHEGTKNEEEPEGKLSALLPFPIGSVHFVPFVPFVASR